MTRNSIEALNMGRGIALLTDGNTIPITACFDGDGDECDPLDGALTAVAGPDGGGKFWTVLLSEFSREQTQ